MTEKKKSGEKDRAATDAATAKWVGIGAGAALGSAALAAAVLYATRARKAAEPPKPPVDAED